MRKMMLKMSSFFRFCGAKRLFIGGQRVDSPGLRNLSDRCLEDIGLTPNKTNFEAAKPFWLA
jgi:hypothetical protein